MKIRFMKRLTGNDDNSFSPSNGGIYNTCVTLAFRPGLCIRLHNIHKSLIAKAVLF